MTIRDPLGRVMMRFGKQFWGEEYQHQQFVEYSRLSKEGMMRGKHPGNENLSSQLPIEHLMPQTRNPEDWPLPPNAGEDTEAARQVAIHRLGNLTLVNHGLNSKLSNLSWAKKQQILRDEDNLYINKELLTYMPETDWDEEQINSRGHRLADYITKIWPRGHEVTGEIERIQM